MKNLTSRKRHRIRQLIESASARLVLLPPYCPDLNPIEMICVKIKQALRSLACRTVDTLWKAMQGALDQISASDALNGFKHCGYTLHLD